MRHRWRIAAHTLVLWIAWAGVSETFGEKAPNGDVQRLISLLRARDASLRTIRIPFNAFPLDSEPEVTAGHHPTQLKTGWWEGRAKQGYAATYWAWNAGKAYAEHRAVWDGLRLRDLLVNLGESRPDAWPAVLTLSNNPGTAFPTYFPPQYGLTYLYQSWSDVLSASKRVEVRERESVLGRDCLRLLFEYGPGSGEEFDRPVEVWFDDHETLLALRIQTFLLTTEAETLKLTPAEAQAASVRCGSRDYLKYLSWEVARVERLPDGLWLATRGIETLSSKDVQRFVTVIESKGVRFNKGFSDEEPDTRPSAGTLCVDTIQSDTWVVDVHGSRCTPHDEIFVSAVRSAAQEDGLPDPKPPLEHHDFRDSTCGPNAVLFLDRLAGGTAQLSDLVTRVAPEEKKTGITSLWTVKELAESCGFHAYPMRMDAATLRRWGGNAIVQLTSDPQDDERHHSTRPRLSESENSHDSHFAIAKVMDDEVRLISAPGKPERVPIDRFDAAWSGYALLVSKDPIDVASLTVGTRWIGFARVGLLVLAGVFGVGWFVLGRGFRAVGAKA